MSKIRYLDMLKDLSIFILVFIVALGVNACPTIEGQNNLGPIQKIGDHVLCSSLQIEYDVFEEYRDQLRFPIVDQTVSEEYSKREQRLISMAEDCQNRRFEMCYSDLKPSIKKQNLDVLFNEWTQDGRFHYLSGGGGACEVRAKNLAHELAKLGYEAKAVRIHPAPTLIAMEKTRDGELTGGFYDYHGRHSVVQIMVEENGKFTPYILDPQFMNKPLKKSDYFIETIGQDCSKVDSYDGEYDILSSLECYYSINPQNSQIGHISPYQVLNNNEMKCGWLFDVTESESFASAANSNPIIKEDKKLVLLNGLNGVGVAPKFNDINVSDSSSSELILYAYEQLRSKIEERLAEHEQRLSELNSSTPSFLFTEEEIEKDKSYYKKSIEQLRSDLANYSATMEKVRRNLNN